MAGIDPGEAAVLDAIDDGEIVRDLAELVAVPSVDGTPGERAAQQWCADRLTDLGLRVDCWEIDLDAARQHPDYPGMEVERSTDTGGALGCVGVLGDESATPALALCGHTDVVPPGDPALWPRDPFTMRVDDGLAWGRGTCDMKAGLVAAIGAVAAVRRSGVELAASLAVHCVSAEEDGGVGAFATLHRGHTASTCVIAEPTGGDIVRANAGSLTFRIEVPGRATHGSTRTRGVSAIEKFEVIHRALHDLEAARNAEQPDLFAHLDLPWPLSVGVVSAGDWASTVPDRLVAEGRFGVRPGESLEAAMAAFEAAISRAAADDPWLADHPVRISWPGGRFAPGALPEGHRLAGDVAAAVADVRGAAPRSVGGPYGSDLRHYAAAGVATVQYGPGEVRFAHAVDEHVELADVFACARVYALLVLRSCRPVG